MMDHETLQERAEAYLTSLICEAADARLTFDAETPFGEIGINSFLVLKILKRLEQDFGTLPKTLLFENFNVRDLARYFVRSHADALTRLVMGTAPADREASPLPQIQAAPSVALQSAQAPLPTFPAVEKVPRLVAVKRLDRYPDLARRRLEIFDQYKNESSVSRGTQTIAPLLFFGDEQRGYFNCGKSKGILLAYGYTGPEDHFQPLVEQLYRYCNDHGLQFNLFAERRLPPIGGKAFSATPFGVMQRVVDLPSFTLQGQAMRRLRYLVSKFSNAGVCRTEEYVCGTDPAKASQIAAIIDQWCATRTMVNPLIHVVKDEILAGTLDGEHRLFLAYVDDVMQNAILISPMSAGRTGYLMDLEFYGPDMPQGGLEYAIVNMIETLRDEGCDVLSLGGTYGCKLADSPDADPQIEGILEDLRQQNIFNDAGNLQFKNKFRPVSSDIFLCRATDAGKAENVLDIILMIADPSTTDIDETPDAEAVPVAAAAGKTVQHVASDLPPASTVAGAGPRWHALEAAGFNPQNLPAGLVEFDLKTDSWAQLQLSAIDRQMTALFAQIQRPIDVDASLRAVFPFTHFTLTESGRAAEDLFCQAWEKKGRVPQNILFPSTIFHQIDKGFSPREMPSKAAFDLHSAEPYTGNIDLSALQAEIDGHGADIGYVCIELTDNAAGGGCVSLPHLKQVKGLLEKQGISLVLDATRVVENALVIAQHDPDWRAAPLWEIVAALLSQADVVVASLAKDFCVNKGGLIATNDQALHARLQSLQQRNGKALDVIDRKCVALSLQNRSFIEAQVRRRVERVASLGRSLSEGNVPVARAAHAHCVLIDVKAIAEFRDLESPVPSFLAWLYLATGIRAGAHSVGMQENTTLNQLVRLAIPVGLTSDEVRRLGELIAGAFANKANIPDLGCSDGHRVGDINTTFKLNRRLYPVDLPPPTIESVPRVESSTTPTGSQVHVAPAAQLPQRQQAAPDAEMEIAIVGMAARFPKARNAEELWQNLSTGRDCIAEIPQSRFDRRRNRDALGRYRGGFIDDVDRFDSLFF
ncbi:MAG: beta-eliminating lyase-related protein, partial [Pseudomonadota bacterium]|nr:beta-eliminating lyase-related protein [Pseudomonadota bacterium]